MTTLIEVSATTARTVRRTCCLRRSTTGQSGTADGSRSSALCSRQIPRGIRRSPTTNRAGSATKTTSPAYGLLNNPSAAAMSIARNTTAEAVVMTTPATDSGCRRSAPRSSTGAPLLQALQVRHQRVQIRRRQLAVVGRHRRLLGGLGLRRHFLWSGDPLPDLVGRQLLADAVEGVC